MHGGTPEVVEEDILERRVGPEVAVVLDGGYVVEDEPAPETVEVNGEGGRGDQGRQCSPRRHSHVIISSKEFTPSLAGSSHQSHRPPIPSTTDHCTRYGSWSYCRKRRRRLIAAAAGGGGGGGGKYYLRLVQPAALFSAAPLVFAGALQKCIRETTHLHTRAPRDKLLLVLLGTTLIRENANFMMLLGEDAGRCSDKVRQTLKLLEARNRDDFSEQSAPVSVVFSGCAGRGTAK